MNIYDRNTKRIFLKHCWLLYVRNVCVRHNEGVVWTLEILFVGEIAMSQYIIFSRCYIIFVSLSIFLCILYKISLLACLHAQCSLSSLLLLALQCFFLSIYVLSYSLFFIRFRYRYAFSVWFFLRISFLRYFFGAPLSFFLFVLRSLLLFVVFAWGFIYKDLSLNVRYPHNAYTYIHKGDMNGHWNIKREYTHTQH